ncbi:MAG: hypothetical protein ACRYGI_00450 [Janthinobacterium lividum]
MAALILKNIGPEIMDLKGAGRKPVGRTTCSFGGRTPFLEEQEAASTGRFAVGYPYHVLE